MRDDFTKNKQLISFQSNQPLFLIPVVIQVLQPNHHLQPVHLLGPAGQRPDRPVAVLSRSPRVSTIAPAVDSRYSRVVLRRFWFARFLRGRINHHQSRVFGAESQPRIPPIAHRLERLSRVFRRLATAVTKACCHPEPRPSQVRAAPAAQ